MDCFIIHYHAFSCVLIYFENLYKNVSRAVIIVPAVNRAVCSISRQYGLQITTNWDMFMQVNKTPSKYVSAHNISSFYFLELDDNLRFALNLFKTRTRIIKSSSCHEANVICALNLKL